MNELIQLSHFLFWTFVFGMIFLKIRKHNETLHTSDTQTLK